MSHLKDVFTKEDCETILKNYLNSSNFVYLSHEIKSLSGEVEGYLAEHFSLIVHYEENNISNRSQTFFVKAILNQKGFLAVFARDMDVFRKETFLYTKLFRQYEQHIKNYKKIAPECYLSKNSMLVLEDLAEQGYQPAERLKFYTFEQCQTSLEIIAKFHAYSIVYEEVQSKKLNKTFRLNEEYPMEFEDRVFGKFQSKSVVDFLEASIQSLLDLIEEIPENLLPEQDRIKQLLSKTYNNNSNESAVENKFRLVSTHGDLWPNNIMFKYKNSELINCLLIDFQLLNYSMPGFDLELFFYGNTNYEFRKQHKKELIQYYYKCFSDVLSDNNINIDNIMTYKDLLNMCILTGPVAKVQAVCDMCILHLPEETYAQAKEIPDFHKTVLVDNRSKHVVKNYKNNSKFREIIINELNDLKDVLEAKEHLLNTI